MNIRDRLQRLKILLNAGLSTEEKQGQLVRLGGIVAFVAAILGVILRLLRFAHVASTRPLLPATFIQVNDDGFGDRQNSYAWSMAWFKGKLYVGTNRNFLCVEKATIDFHVPELNLYAAQTFPGEICPPTPQDLNLKAEIWCYAPQANTWRRVFQSPEVPIPDHPGKYVALDIGFRDMAVCLEPDGTEALYIAGVTAREYTPGLLPPRLLRSADGARFEPLPQQAGTVLGDLDAIGFRAMTVYQRRLYVTATSGLLGDGIVLEAADPARGNNHFRFVSPQDLRVFELAVFRGFLYVGTMDRIHGYSVWKTDATGPPPYHFTPVVTDGAGRGAVMQSVVSMQVFQDCLYVGSCGWFPQLLPPCELIRIHPDDRWELVVGSPRRTPQDIKVPISGLPDSFGNPFNVHIWRMQEHEGALYLGVCEESEGVQVPSWLDARINEEYGFDLWRSDDGKAWKQVTRNGFGDRCNHGIRTFASTPYGLFVGTANHVSGTEIWLVTDA